MVSFCVFLFVIMSMNRGAKRETFKKFNQEKLISETCYESDQPLFLEIKKALTKLSKEKRCEIIGRWRKACVRQFYWAVTSTQEHLGEVKRAKFHAFLSHVINKHSNFPNRLFNACAHDEIVTPGVWLTKGTKNVLRCTFINPRTIVRIAFRGLTLISLTVADIIN